MKRGIVSKVLWDWYDAIRTGRFKSRNASILVHDPSGSDDLIEFQLVDAFPVKWVGPELSASAEQPGDRDPRTGPSGAAAEEVRAMPVHIEKMTSDVSIREGDSRMSPADVERVVNLVITRLDERARDAMRARAATTLTRQASKPLDAGC